MKPALTLLLLLLFKTGLTQSNEKLKARIAELKTAGVDTTIVYYMYCADTRPRLQAPLMPCEVEKIRYLMWQQDGKSRIQRFDECKNYQPQLMNTKLVTFIKANFEKIIADSIPPPLFKNDGKNGEFEIAVKSAHYCDNVFVFNTGNGEYMQRIYKPFINQKYVGREKKLNIYHKHNMRSPLKKLIDMVEKEPYIQAL
ncbi:hypothetical protein LJ707_13570 [Mucilaginibacter sp. UR6-1]|uniref:hypothetical protein n=1 Tax=Mucilaginibacter sp. UR6-1 TaxID=1435643 RepID=UPI001E62F484|nr:hypothetical protein [Mucilaginibacter sp. UR6-1]MCC8409962.1 hypothetical protein [Mucilaginibacter sp. UR6-1]